MKECLYCRNIFIECLYNEIEPDKMKVVNDHLKLCNECSAEFNKMKSILDVMSEKKSNDPGNDYWDGYYGKLMKRINNDTSIEQVKKARKRISGAVIQWGYRILSAAAMIAVGIFIGYRYYGQPRPFAVTNGESGNIIKQEALYNLTSRYLERSKILLLGIVNFNESQIDPATIDFSYQKKISRDLINDAPALKNKLAESDNARLLALISELELLFLQISNYKKQFDVPAIDLIKSGVNNQSILMKINLEELNMSGRQEKNRVNKNINVSNKTNL